MEDIFKERRLMALKIQSARLRVERELSEGTITTEDLVCLVNQSSDYGIAKVSTTKEKLLQELFNSPFLLCDQDMLDWDVKQILPNILRSRYSMEMKELKQLCKLGFITKEELKRKGDLVRYCYYYTSEEGQYILRRGHVKNVKDNVIKENKVLKIGNL